MYGSSLHDNLLNTLAAILALIRHTKSPYHQIDSYGSDLGTRIKSAKSYLEAALALWDINAADHVGFEFLISAHLSMLENEQMTFNFPCKEAFQALNKLKMENFRTEIFYSFPSTLLHSLEGLVGKIDFDRLSHHEVFGSMMGSPASTAADLMHPSTWDDSAECYLRKVIDKGSGKGMGGVPSAFPIPVFESTWV